MKVKIPLIVIILAVILIAGGLIFALKYPNKKFLSEQNLKDSDNDGLKDWEEELCHTNPYNPDTDGDGYLDGEEVDSGRNPLVKAPGDKLSFYPLPLGEKYNITKKVLNEEVIDSMLDSYISQKGEYITDHSEIYSPETYSASTKESTIQEISKRALADSYPILIEKAEQAISEMPEIFDINIADEDINISENNSPEAIKLYLFQAYSFLNSDTFFLQEQSFQALIAAFQNDDFSKLNELIKVNDEKIEKIKQIIVPSSWKEIHKQGLGLTLLIRNIYVSFRDIQNDPLKAYTALEKMENFSDNWNDLMEKALKLAEEQDIELSL